MSRVYNKFIIMVSGWKGSGKDTFSSFLTSKYGFKRIAFADVLKDQVSRRYCINRYIFDDQSKKEEPLSDFPVSDSLLTADMLDHYKFRYGRRYHTPRSLLILEAKLARSINKNVWVEYVADQIRSYDYDRIIITDYRYNNEYHVLKELFPHHKIITIRINRFDTLSCIDQSEHSLDKFNFDFIINNKGTISDLKKEAEVFIETNIKSNDYSSNNIQAGQLILTTGMLILGGLYVLL